MSSLVSMPQGAEWLVILAIVVLVFGAAKLPDLARGTGQALRIFKSETKGLRDDHDDDIGSEARSNPVAELPQPPEPLRTPSPAKAHLFTPEDRQLREDEGGAS